MTVSDEARRFQHSVTASRVVTRYASTQGLVSGIVEMLIKLLDDAVHVMGSGVDAASMRPVVEKLTSVYEREFAPAMKRAKLSGADPVALQALGTRMFECVVCFSPSRLAVIDAGGPRAGKLVEAIQAVPRAWNTLRRAATKVDETSTTPKVTDVTRVPGPPSNPWATTNRETVRVTGENLTDTYMQEWAADRYDRPLMQVSDIRRVRQDEYLVSYLVYMN